MAEKNLGTNGLHDSEISPEAAARRRQYFEAAEAADGIDEERFIEQATLWYRELFGDDAEENLAHDIEVEGSLAAAVAMYG